MKEGLISPQGFSTERESSLTDEQLRNFRSMLREAQYAEAYPDQSGFFVRTAGMAKDGSLWRGGNKEYGFSDAFIHGETAVVSGLRDLTNSPIEIIAWYKEGKLSAGDFGRPCGNCRDILKKYCDPSTVLLNGNIYSFVYTRLKDFLFDDFQRIDKPTSTPNEINLGLSAARGANDVYLPEHLKGEVYGALLIGENGRVWPGLHYTNVGYDSVTPVMSSILAWRSDYPTGKVSQDRLRLSKLLIVGEKKTPNVFYRDRQAILELDEILRKFTGRGEPLKVEIVNAGEYFHWNNVATEVFETTTEEWIPHPFSPGAFRMDDVMLGQLGKIIGQKNLQSLG